MMKLIALVAVSLCMHASARQESKVTPIEKVMELLKNLQKEVEAEGQAEATAYDKYACFCKEQADEKLYMIEKSTKKIAKLDAKIKDLEADISELNAAIKDLATEIERLTGEIDEAAAARAKAHAAYLVVDEDTVGALTAMGGAIAALKDAKGAMSGNVKTDFAQLAQTVLAVAAANPRRAIPQSQVDAVVEFAQVGADQPAYEVRSNGILQTLEEMKDTFNENKKADDTEEFDANSAWEKKDLNLKKVKKFSEDEKFQKEQFVEAKTEEMQKANVDKATEIKDKGADNEFMTVLTEECEGKAEQFDQRSKARTGELTALAGALDALAQKVAPSAGANKKLAQLQMPTSFVQLRGAASSQAAATATAYRAADFLSDAASRIGSTVLALAAARAGASADHFVKVRQIIKDLVSKLEADAAAEADQKSFCDKAIGENTKARDGAIAQVEGLTSKKSQLTAEDGQLHKEITELATDIASLNKGLKEATGLRAEEQVENEATLATAEEGRAGTELALKILNDFYAAAGGSLAQFTPPGAGRDGKSVGDMAPDSPDGEYKGNQEKATGIVGMLEVILSDFERTIKVTTEDEQTAQDEFDAYRLKTEEDVATKEGSKQEKEDRRTAIADELIANGESLTEETALWETSKKALEELKSQCIDGEESYEDRVAKRKKEIEALKQAHDILEDWKGF